jgi:uncharacterized membrane protein
MPIIAMLGVNPDALGFFRNSPTMTSMNATTWNNVYSAFGISPVLLIIIPVAIGLLILVGYSVRKAIELPSRTDSHKP